MKKLIVVLLLISMIATPSYALNILDNMIYKKDLLKSKNRLILVNRLTGEVKYIWRDDGEWVALTGQWKNQYQKMYDVQTGRK